MIDTWSFGRKRLPSICLVLDRVWCGCKHLPIVNRMIAVTLILWLRRVPHSLPPTPQYLRFWRELPRIGSNRRLLFYSQALDLMITLMVASLNWICGFFTGGIPFCFFFLGRFHYSNLNMHLQLLHSSLCFWAPDYFVSPFSTCK